MYSSIHLFDLPGTSKYCTEYVGLDGRWTVAEISFVSPVLGLFGLAWFCLVWLGRLEALPCSVRVIGSQHSMAR